MNAVRRAASYIVLVSVYGFTWMVAAIGRAIPRRDWKPTGRILVTGTFHNLNWYLSHVIPLSRSGVNEVILVIDEPQAPIEGVKFVCPPRWISKLFSRAGAKAVWMIIAGLRYRPDLYMGYHLAPGACSALVAGTLLGRPVCYQMTAGPVEIIGGGIGATESVGGVLGHPSKLIERMAFAVAGSFDLLVVRGRKAREFLENHSIRSRVAVITGSVPRSQATSWAERKIHMVFVGRLAPIKQVDQFISIVEQVFRRIPAVRAAVVGEGPLTADLKARASAMGLADNIEFLGKREDVQSVLLDSRVFILTSQSEGLSIAMVEAMAAGAVPVVGDVGELGDLVENGVNGYLVTPNCVAEYVERILPILQDRDRWEKFSRSASDTALGQCGIDVVSGKWREQLRSVIDSNPGVRTEEAMK